MKVKMKEDTKITVERIEIKNSKKDIDSLIETIKNRGGSVPINGDFTIQFDYVDDLDIKEVWQGFSVTIWPKDRDGSGISIKFDPYDNKICSGLVEVLEESRIANNK